MKLVFAVYNMTKERWVEGSESEIPATCRAIAEKHAAFSGDTYEVRKYGTVERVAIRLRK